MSEFGEWVYPSELEYIFESMDYVGLGHWHKFGNVKKYPNVYYSGSTERTSLNDKSNQKGYVQISLDDSLSIEYKQIQIREVVSVEIDCKEYLANTMNLQNYPNAIVDVTLKNLTPTQSLDIKNSDIREMFCDSLYVNIKREIENSESKSYSDISAISLEEFFLEQIKKECDSSEYERLRDRVIELFGEVDDTN
jgi:DNA repair exonuclease SbcCD nuclease subunit